MNISTKTFNPLTSKHLFLTCIFIIFIIPYSILYNNVGLSANYTFIFFPIIIILLTGSIKIPDNNIIIITLLFSIIFFISLLYQVDFYKYFHRRVISFILFMTAFSYLFIHITDDMVKAFKTAVVLFSCAFSLIKLGDYYILGGHDLGFRAKYKLGSQRFGFLYILAFWIVTLYQPKFKLDKILKGISFTIIILGLINTFSRSSVLALLGCAIIFFCLNFSLTSKIPKFYSIIKYLFFIILFTLCFVLIFPNHVDFYSERIINFFLKGTFYYSVTEHDPGSSLGYRLMVFKEIFNFVLHNPFTGSGFLGCWILYDNLTCSAHSQYVDVLLRTGLVDFLFYIYLLFRILQYLRSTNRDLFYGFVSILIISLVHETFKLSHGAFILSFLIGMSYNKKSINIKS